MAMFPMSHRPSMGVKTLLLACVLAATLAPGASRASGFPVVDIINWVEKYLQ